jgi:branched-chain amino acid transport system permease protein
VELIDAYLKPVVDGLAFGLLLFIVAAGLTLAFGVAEVLNLAHGTIYLAGGYVAVVLSDGSWSGLLIGILAGAAVGVASGGVLSAAVAPLTGRGPLAQALLTFGISLAGGALLVLAFGADDLRPKLPDFLDASTLLLGHRYSVYRLLLIGVGALLAVAIWLVVTRTKAGALVRAMVDDRDMVAGLGTNPKTVLSGVLAAAGGLAGAAGALGAPLIGPGPSTANTVMLLSLVVVVLGGLGSIGGAFLAALAVGQVENLGVVLNDKLAPYLLFAAMVVALLFRRPQITGLGGRT